MAAIDFKGKDFRGKYVEGKCNFDRVVKLLQQRREYNHIEASMPEMPVGWIDRGIPLTSQLHFHGPGEHKAVALQLGSKNFIEYPVAPRIDREGIAFSSMMNKLEVMHLSARSDLVLSSETMFSGTETYWVERLMVYLNTSVSLIDSMLIILYYKAKHDGKQMGWTFDEGKLGHTNCPRMLNKFKWVFRITGKESYITGAEMEAFDELKKVRNHLNHFDPPIFACTIEDAARWLNHLRSVAMIALKIREASGCTISKNVIKLLLAPDVIIKPFDPNIVRLPQGKSGYASCFQ